MVLKKYEQGLAIFPLQKSLSLMVSPPENFRQDNLLIIWITGSHTIIAFSRCTSSFRGNRCQVGIVFAQVPRLVFDNLYYSNLVNKKAQLHSDRELFNGCSADALVKRYAGNPSIMISPGSQGTRERC
ncbi:hypothetical protein OIU78_030455, partial [Salix suchowensis]